MLALVKGRAGPMTTYGKMTGDRQRSGGFSRGIFVIPLDQVEIDGFCGASAATIFVGSQLRWWGAATRIDGPDGFLTLDGAEGQEDVRQRAGRSVRRLLGDLSVRHLPRAVRGGTIEPGSGLTVTDGLANYRLTLAGEGRLIAIAGPLPPRDTDLVVTEKSPGLARQIPKNAAIGGVICFVAGAHLSTPDGVRPVETFRPGDRVTTRDNGAQEVLWTGHQRLSGARLFAMPHLRPIRIHSGAFGDDRPEGDLLVSPEHRLLLTGRRARDLFNDTEVLVAARHLVDDSMIRPVAGLRDVTYVHLMTARHEIVRANGVEAETFHPASADLARIAPGERAALAAVAPDLDRDPFAYGGFARRALTAPEAALLRFAPA